MGGHERAADAGKSLPGRIAHTGQESRMQVQADFAMDVEIGPRRSNGSIPRPAKPFGARVSRAGGLTLGARPIPGPAVLYLRLDA